MSARDPLQELPELQELKDALSFETSPDFCARVRRQVAAEPVRSRTVGARGWALAAAVMLTTAVGGLLTYRSGEVEVTPVSRPAIVDVVESLAGPQPEVVAAIAPVRAASRRAVATARVAVTPFETLVPDDQRRALDSLLAAMREGRATVPPAMLDEELNDNGQRVPRALIIEPVKLELLAGTQGEPIKDPVKDPIK